MSEPLSSRTFIFIITKDCQFRCKYCYLVEKNSYEVMSEDMALQIINFILSETTFKEDAVVLDFIGGEPLMEINLIDKTCEYFVSESKRIGHKWNENFTIRITTNGLLYDREDVQNFLSKYKDNISLSISLDGTKQKNDINRIYKSGKGTYDSIIGNVMLWIEQFPNSESRMTVSHEDLPYIMESAIHLINLGIKDIDIRIVNENVWQPGDNIIYENQLIKLADYILTHDCECKLSCFHNEKGLPIHENTNISCGNKTISIDSHGNLYPCHRFASYSLRTKNPIIIGNVNTGLNQNRMRPFASFNIRLHNDLECNNCEIAGDCRFCLAEDYDSADTDTIFQHSKAICQMHKAEVRAFNYYWRKQNQLI